MLTLTLAAAAGLSVANIYLAQPLLETIARDFSIEPASVGLIVTLTQIGYGVGLILVVPLGDLIDRRHLIVGQTLLSAIALIAVALATSATMLFIALVAVGLLAVTVQILVASAATLAAPTERGRAVGAVTSGVVIGILGARFAAGALADLGGWRSVYLVSAALTGVMAAMLFAMLPARSEQPSQQSYFSIVRSVPAMFLGDGVLLIRGVLALLIFAGFSTFWTALVLPLSVPPFDYSHTGIGLFGLVGVAGALAASSAGGLADRGFAQWTTGASLVILLASWGLIALLPTSVVALLIGVVLLDLAVQAVHVSNQSIIFARYPHARSRMVGGYMVFYSVGSALGAIASTMIYARFGWAGVSTLGAGISLTALVFWAATRRLEAPLPSKGVAAPSTL